MASSSTQLDPESAAAFVFRTIGSMDGLAEVLSYWTFTGIFEEHSPADSHSEFSSNFGLITPRGVRKPGWRAFELLHTHAGSHRLSVETSISSEIYALATANVTGTKVVTGSVRVFLSWWAGNIARDNVSLIATPPPPPRPGYTVLDGDCSGHNLQELPGMAVPSCGNACNTAAGCLGFSFQLGPGAHQPHENCVLKSSSCGGHGSPSGAKFVFYEKAGGRRCAPAVHCGKGLLSKLS